MRNRSLATAALALALAASACLPRAAGSPEATVEGALRVEASLYVAPAGFRSGQLTPELAAAWISAQDAQLAQWFAGSAFDAQRLGLRNVVNSHVNNAAPIVTSVDITDVHVPAVAIDGDTGTVANASINYVSHMAPGTWDQAEIPGVTMCLMELRRANSEWRVVDESCNVSGG